MTAPTKEQIDALRAAVVGIEAACNREPPSAHELLANYRWVLNREGVAALRALLDDYERLTAPVALPAGEPCEIEFFAEGPIAATVRSQVTGETIVTPREPGDARVTRKRGGLHAD